VIIVIIRRYRVSDKSRKRREGSLSPNDMETQEEGAREKGRDGSEASSGVRRRAGRWRGI